MDHSSFDELIRPRDIFKEQILQRVAKGEEIAANDPSDDYEARNLSQAYSDWHDYNIEFLKTSFNNPINEYRLSYEAIGEPKKKQVWVSSAGSQHVIVDAFQKTRNKLWKKIDNLRKLHNKADLIKSTTSGLVKEHVSERDTSKVFIVHGHDDALKQEVARFIEKLGLESIILHEKASSSATVIEKIEKYGNVGFAIILYTHCDDGYSKDYPDKVSPRSRQNVVFEHGYFWGKIGRERVCAIVKGKIETPSDLSGVVYISFEGHWKLDLAREMSASGYAIDLKKIL